MDERQRATLIRNMTDNLDMEYVSGSAPDLHEEQGDGQAIERHGDLYRRAERDYQTQRTGRRTKP